MKHLLLVSIIIMGLNTGQTANSNPQVRKTYSGSSAVADSIPPDSSGMRAISAIALAKEMIPGWSTGNSLDATPGGETSWGNPMIAQYLIDSIKAAGFRSVRIPIAWSNNMDTATFTIDPSLLYRVQEVVNYVVTDGLYAIVNLHWDGGWIQPTYAKQEYVNRRLAAMWGQIATVLGDFDDHLLFAGTNEIQASYAAPSKENAAVQNSFNQTFVTAVRSTGGRNVYRRLLVQGYNTNIDYTISTFVMPRDVAPDRLIVEVHYYDPYDYTINSNTTFTQWGKYATSSSKTAGWGNEDWADGQFLKIQRKFIDSGYAVILGEYGAMARKGFATAELDSSAAWYRRYYLEYITSSICRHGLVPVYWDNGGTGNNGMGLFSRNTGAQAYPDMIKAIVLAADTTEVITGVQLEQTQASPERFALSQNYPNPFNPTTVIGYELPVTSKISLKVYDLLGKEVATVFEGIRPPGKYEAQFSGEKFASGVYFYRLVTGMFVQTKKLILIK